MTTAIEGTPTNEAVEQGENARRGTPYRPLRGSGMKRVRLRPLIEPVHEPNLWPIGGNHGGGWGVWRGWHMHIRPEGATRWNVGMEFGETPSQLQTYLNHVDAHRKAHQ